MSEPQPLYGERIARLETLVTGIEKDVEEIDRRLTASGETKIKMRIAVLGLVGVTITAAGGLLTALLVSGGHP